MFQFLKRWWNWLKAQLSYEKEPEKTGEEEFFPEEPEAVPPRPIHPYEALIFTPASFGDVRKAADALEQGRLVLLCLQSIDSETAGKMVDFLSGAVYLLKGSMQMMGTEVVLCTPSSINVRQDDFTFHGADELLRWKGFE